MKTACLPYLLIINKPLLFVFRARDKYMEVIWDTTVTYQENSAQVWSVAKFRVLYDMYWIELSRLRFDDFAVQSVTGNSENSVHAETNKITDGHR